MRAIELYELFEKLSNVEKMKFQQKMKTYEKLVDENVLKQRQELSETIKKLKDADGNQYIGDEWINKNIIKK